MLNILAPILLALAPVNPTLVKVNVSNAQHIQTIGGRDVTFGVKETVEELLIDKGYTPTETNVEVVIDETPGYVALTLVDAALIALYSVVVKILTSGAVLHLENLPAFLAAT